MFRVNNNIVNVDKSGLNNKIARQSMKETTILMLLNVLRPLFCALTLG